MTNAKRLLIIGTGGHARPVIDTALQLGFEIIGLIDLQYTGAEETILGIQVLGGAEVLSTIDKNVLTFVAIGDNADRKNWINKLTSAGYTLPNLCHPTAIISEHSKLSSGSFVNAGAIINAKVTLGDGCIINTGVIIDHETDLKAFIHIAPGAIIAGRVKIGELTFVGAGAVIIDKILIGENTVIGANSTIIENISSNSKVVGVSKLI